MKRTLNLIVLGFLPMLIVSMQKPLYGSTASQIKTSEELKPASGTATAAMPAPTADVKKVLEEAKGWTKDHDTIADLYNADTLDANAMDLIVTLIEDLIAKKENLAAKDPRAGKTLLEHAQALDNDPYYDKPDLRPSHEFADDWKKMIALLSEPAAEEKIKLEIPKGDPLKLGFAQVKKDQYGRIVGWLTIPDYNDAIYVRITTHKSGYSIQYLIPENYESLKSQKNISDTNGLGLFFWKSIAQLRESPKHETAYLGDDSFLMADSEGALWHPESSWLVTQSADKKTKTFTLKDPFKHWESAKIKNIYRNIASLYQNFGGPYRVFLLQYIAPIIIDKKQVIEHFKKTHPNTEFWAVMYKNADQADRDIILKLFPQTYLSLMNEWLDDKIKNSGLAVAEQEKIKNQYIYEAIVKAIRLDKPIDIRDLLTEIDDLDYCTAQLRNEMTKELSERGEHIFEQMTAVGKITCNPGLRQQD